MQVQRLPADPRAELDRAVSDIARWATRNRTRRALRSADEAALPPTEWWLLERIVLEGPQRMRDLADWQSVDRSTMTAQVRYLEKLGLISREPDPDDRRGVLVRATDAGVKALAEHQTAMRDFYGRLIASWPEPERAQLATLLTRFARALSAPPQVSES